MFFKSVKDVFIYCFLFLRFWFGYEFLLLFFRFVVVDLIGLVFIGVWIGGEIWILLGFGGS